MLLSQPGIDETRARLGSLIMGSSSEHLQVFDHWPSELNEIGHRELAKHLGGPSLFYIQGEKDPPLVISTLLHGNEETGFYALQNIMPANQGRPPRSLVVILGNLDAAAAGLRHMPDGPDFNRIWDSSHPFATAVKQELRGRDLFGVIDIHNNTGRNPFYACVSRNRPEFLHLGLLFSRTLVYFEQPASTFSVSMSDHAPTIVVECGRSSQAGSVEHATEFLESAMRLDHLPGTPPSPHDYSLYTMQAALKIPAGCSVDIADADADFCFREDLDQLNFLPSDEPRFIGRRRRDDLELVTVNTFDTQIEIEGIYYEGDQMFLAPGWTPSMFTLDLSVMVSDSLGYLMRETSADALH